MAGPGPAPWASPPGPLHSSEGRCVSTFRSCHGRTWPVCIWANDDRSPSAPTPTRRCGEHLLPGEGPSPSGRPALSPAEALKAGWCLSASSPRVALGPEVRLPRPPKPDLPSLHKQAVENHTLAHTHTHTRMCMPVQIHSATPSLHKCIHNHISGSAYSHTPYVIHLCVHLHLYTPSHTTQCKVHKHTPTADAVLLNAHSYPNPLPQVIECGSIHPPIYPNKHSHTSMQLHTFTGTQTYTHIFHGDTCTCIKTLPHIHTGTIPVCKHPHAPDRRADTHMHICPQAYSLTRAQGSHEDIRICHIRE